MMTVSMAAAGLAVVAAMGLAGCGGGSSQKVASLTGSSGRAATTTTVSKQSAQKLWNEFAACMRQHGVQMADPVLNNDGLPTNAALSGGSGGSGSAGSAPKSAALQASQACQTQLQAAMKAGGKSVGTGTKVDPVQAAKFSKCMRAHGVPDFPDPQTSTGGIKIEGSSSGSSPPADLNPDSPVFKNAQKACGGLLPGKAGSGLQVVRP